MNETDDETTDHSTLQTRLSNEQKALLQRLMNHQTNFEDACSSQKSRQKTWSKIAIQLNKIPGARKSWAQWRMTWSDIQKNSTKSNSEALIDYGTYVTEEEFSLSEEIVDNDMNIDNATENVEKDVDDSEDDDFQQVVGDNRDIYVKRQRAQNMSVTQRKLLYSLVNSNEHLYKDKLDGVSTSCLKKRKEWKKIALKLNSVTGPQKTWTQWNKCWHDIRKYYIRRNAVEQIFNSDTDDVNASVDGDLVAKVKRKGNCKDTAPKATILKCYERIKGERSKNIRSDSVSIPMNDHQLQLLQRTADQECNIAGSLVAVKLRSMQREQKLIAEKLISEILFQGQMEMFQYSDKAVHIAGYMQ